MDGGRFVAVEVDPRLVVVVSVLPLPDEPVPVLLDVGLLDVEPRDVGLPGVGLPDVELLDVELPDGPAVVEVDVDDASVSAVVGTGEDVVSVDGTVVSTGASGSVVVATGTMA